MPRIYLHIGRGKTGTTQLQHFLASNAAQLRAAGIRYAEADDRLRGVGHQAFAKSFIHNPPKYMTMQPEVPTIRAAIRDELLEHNEDNFLYSSENFTMADPFEVRSFFLDINSNLEFRIIFFARTQEETAESEYNQLVKWTGMTSTFSGFLKDEFIEDRYDELLDPWRSAFGLGNIRVAIYNEGPEALERKFIDCLQIRPFAMNLTKNIDAANSSVGAITLAVYRMANKYPIEQRRSLFSELAKQLREIDVPALMFNAEEALDFRSRYRDSNINFTRLYLGRSLPELGGRRYSDLQRDEIVSRIRSLVDV